MGVCVRHIFSLQNASDTVLHYVECVRHSTSTFAAVYKTRFGVSTPLDTFDMISNRADIDLGLAHDRRSGRIPHASFRDQRPGEEGALLLRHLREQDPLVPVVEVAFIFYYGCLRMFEVLHAVLMGAYSVGCFRNPLRTALRQARLSLHQIRFPELQALHLN